MLLVTVPTPCALPDCYRTPPVGFTDAIESPVPARVPATMICGTGTAVTIGLPLRFVIGPFSPPGFITGRLVNFWTHRRRETCAFCVLGAAAFPTRSVAVTARVARPP